MAQQNQTNFTSLMINWATFDHFRQKYILVTDYSI